MVGAVAQLGEHLLCKQGVSGSIPLVSTTALRAVKAGDLKDILGKKTNCGTIWSE